MGGGEEEGKEKEEGGDPAGQIEFAAKTWGSSLFEEEEEDENARTDTKGGVVEKERGSLFVSRDLSAARVEKKTQENAPHSSFVRGRSGEGLQHQV